MTTQSYIALLALYTVASLVGAANYLLVRFIERKILDFAVIVAVWEILFLVIAGYVLLYYLTSFFGIFVFALLFSGAWLHLKSGGSSQTGIEAFGIMLLATQATLVWGFLIYNIVPFLDNIHKIAQLVNWHTEYYFPNIVFYMGCVLAPWVTAALLAAIRAFKFRPGLDTPIKPETLES